MKITWLVWLLVAASVGCTGSSVVGGPTHVADDASRAADEASPGVDVPSDVGRDAGPAADAVSDVVDATPDALDAGLDAAVVTDDTVDAPVDATEVPRDAPVVPTDDGIDPVPASIDTVAPATARAGDTLTAACLLRNRAGALVAVPPAARVEVRYAPMSLVRSVGGVAVAAHPGTITATCALVGSALVDPTPASIVVSVNVPASTRAVLDRNAISAGESVSVRCEVYDREGNLLGGLPSAPTVTVRPAGNGNTVSDLRVTLQRAGDVAVTCAYPGAAAEASTVTVRPLGAVSLDLFRSPTSDRYGLGELIIFDGIPRDRFRNAVWDVPVTYVSAPAGIADRGLPNHLRYATEGSYTVTARATGEGGVALRADVTVLVDDQGPVTECLSPAHASMLDLAPGSPLHITGRSRDFAGVQQLQVRQNESDTITVLRPDVSGNWTYDIPAARFGINYIDIESIDQFGNTSLESCAFLVSNRWSPEGATLGGTMGFYLNPAAMDDGLPYSPVTSLADLMSAVVNSPALRTQLDGLMRAIDPIYDNRCLVNLGVFGGCQGFVTVHYRGSEFRGPNSTGLQLLNGGLRMTARFQNVRLLVHVDSSLGPADGAVVIGTVDAAASFDVALTGGVPGARLRPGTASVTVGTVTLELPTLDASLVSFVNSAASGPLRTALQTSLQQVVVAQFGAALDGVIGSLAVTGTSGTFPVRGFDGSTTVDLTLATALSALDVTTQRFHLGISTTVSGPTVRTTTSRGVAVPPGATVEPTLATPATLSINLTLFNQLLHAMWRAGLFDTVTPSFTILGFTGPMRTRFNLPPVASFASNGDVIVDLGAMDYDLQMFDPPVNTRIGVRLRSTPRTDGRTLQFGAFRLDELHFAPRGVPLTGAVAAGALIYIRPYLQEITGESLTRALPSIPLPAFAIPPALAAFGLPSGAQLGIVGPRLTVASPYFVLGGTFGDTR